VNVNADEITPDVDILDCNNSIVSHGISTVAGRGGDDVLSAAGERMDEPWNIGLTMLGGTGDDVLTSGESDDVIRGQRGIDTFEASWSDEFVWVVPGTKPPPAPGFPPLSRVAVGGDIGEDQIMGLERFVTGRGDNRFFGTDRAETFISGGGTDEIWPRGGNDVVFGGPGNDTVSFGDAPRGILLSLRNGLAHGDGVDQIAGVESIEGSIFADSIIGDGADNVFLLLGGADIGRGGWGADAIDGGDGSDLIKGGRGADDVYGNRGADAVAGGPGPDTVAGGGGQFDRCRIDPSDSVNSCELPW
jgi:Ca2+-binding RTX toxin-like protein